MFPADHSMFTEQEMTRLDRMKQYKKNGTAYLELQSTRPQTLGYALSDSPVGQLAWIIEKMQEWTDEDKQLPEEAIAIDQLLTNVSLYWFNRLGASTAEMLYENMSMAFAWGSAGDSEETQQWTPPKIPSAMAAFGKKEDESLLKKLTSLTGKPDQWTFYEKGGHFPAMEVPDLLVKDLRTFFSSVDAHSNG